jgi:predicted Fe-S protein YdhL (DUF1289 family)
MKSIKPGEVYARHYVICSDAPPVPVCLDCVRSHKKTGLWPSASKERLDEIRKEMEDKMEDNKKRWAKLKDEWEKKEPSTLTRKGVVSRSVNRGQKRLYEQRKPGELSFWIKPIRKSERKRRIWLGLVIKPIRKDKGKK